MNDFSATPDRRAVASEHVSPERAEKTARDANPPAFLPTPRTKAFIQYLNEQFPATKGHIPIVATVGKLEMDLAEALDRLSRADTNIRHWRELCGKLEAQLRIKTAAAKHDPSTDQWLSNIPSEIFEAARKVHTFFAQQGKAKWEFADIADRALVAELKLELEKLDEHLSAVRTGLLDERDEIREQLKKTTADRDLQKQFRHAANTRYLQTQSERDEARAQNSALREALGESEPWPVADTLSKLAFAARILLEDKDYDGDRHEEIRGCVIAAVDYATKIRTILVATKPKEEA